MARLVLHTQLMSTATAERRLSSPATKPSAVVLLNDRAGPAGREDSGEHPAFTSVRDAFAAAGIDATLMVGNGEALAAHARRAVERGDPLVVAGGGDGTISTIASVVAGTRATLGVLPLGTLNHFAKDLGIPLEVKEAVRVIAAGHTIQADLGEVNGRTFINNSSVGLYPSLVYQREKRQNDGRGKWLAFMLAAARVWRSYRRVRVSVQSQDTSRLVRTPFVFVGNNEYRLEGVSIGARDCLDRGLLHVSMAPGMTRGELLRVLCWALLGRLAEVDHFDTLLAREVTIGAWRRQLPVALDGELMLLRTPLRYRIRPAVLRVCVPAPIEERQ